MIDTILNTLGSIGAGIASSALSLGMLFCAAFAGTKAAEVKGKKSQG